MYQNGEVIPEENIESYFVWIPKYRYKLFDLGNYTTLTSVQNKVQTIDVIFGDYDTKDSVSGECATPGVSGESGACQVGDYMAHPAFLSFGTKGLWVGKFETGYKGATSKEAAEQNTNDTSKVIVKPNVYSWRNINVSNAHLNSYNYKREYDSHMMKNTEWGSVAYLQHSQYGSRSSVRINNNSNFITGYSGVSEPTCGYTKENEECNRYEGTNLNENGEYTKRYNTEVGFLASTTGNISGIYDMSGGGLEYVMGVMLSSNGQPCVGRDSNATSGFAGPYCYTSGSASGINFPEKKYYDTYAFGTDDEHYNRRILGDATGEVGPFFSTTAGNNSSWYTDLSWFVGERWPWICRGSNYKIGANIISGSGAGIFSFDNFDGYELKDGGYRIVLAI